MVSETAQDFAGSAEMGTDQNILFEGALRHSYAKSQGNKSGGHDARDQAKVSQREACRPRSFSIPKSALIVTGQKGAQLSLQADVSNPSVGSVRVTEVLSALLQIGNCK